LRRPRKKAKDRETRDLPNHGIASPRFSLTFRPANRYNTAIGIFLSAVAAFAEGVLHIMFCNALKTPAAAGLGVLLLLASSTASAQETGKPPARLDRLWSDLASPDEGKAMRAALALAGTPQETVRFLKARLVPVKVDAGTVGKLVARLDSDDFATREAAAQDLEYLGKYARPLLEKARDRSESAEVKRAIVDILEKLPSDKPMPPPAPPQLKGRSVSVINRNGDIQIIIDGKPLDLSAMAPPPPAKLGPVPVWKRAGRAISVLEHIGTAEARQIIEAVAGGEDEAFPTRTAKEAMERVKK